MPPWLPLTRIPRMPDMRIASVASSILADRAAPGADHSWQAANGGESFACQTPKRGRKARYSRPTFAATPFERRGALDDRCSERSAVQLTIAYAIRFIRYDGQTASCNG